MQKFMYPSPYMRITQGYMTGTHASSFAIDEGGSDGGKDYMIAPYSGTVKQIYSQFENEVFFESDNKVLFADGTVDYAVTLFVHQDSPMSYGMKIGKHYNQGDKIYIEGGRYAGKNNHFASHCHMEFARGKYTGTGWYKNASGYYSLNNAKKPEECCFIDDTYRILNNNGYHFKNTKELEPKKYGTPVARNEFVDQIEIKENNVRARNSANGEILGYMNKGIYNSLEFVSEVGYHWHRVENNLWFATGPWSNWLPKKEIVEKEDSKMIAELQEKLQLKEKEIEEINKTIECLTKENDLLLEENKSLVKEIEKIDTPTLIFDCKKEDYYAIKLKKTQKLYLG